jgi:hypothetical protein
MLGGSRWKGILFVLLLLFLLLLLLFIFFRLFLNTERLFPVSPEFLDVTRNDYLKIELVSQKDVKSESKEKESPPYGSLTQQLYHKVFFFFFFDKKMLT